LESKRQAKAKGHESPDRADAFVLAFSDYRGIIPQRAAARDVVQYALNDITEEQQNVNVTLEGRLKRPARNTPYFTPTSWSDEIILEVEQLNERLAARG
jgi:hypothetical protein